VRCKERMAFLPIEQRVPGAARIAASLPVGLLLQLHPKRRIYFSTRVVPSAPSRLRMARNAVTVMGVSGAPAPSCVTYLTAPGVRISDGE